MHLLIACPRRLFLLDTVTRELGVVGDDAPEYYGISWTPDGLELATTHSGLDNATLLTLEDYVDSECGHLRLGGRQGVQGLSQPHQVLCTNDHVLITNTGRNCITVARQDDLFFRHVWIDEVRWDRKSRDHACGRHLNSVFFKNDRLFVLAHNNDRASELLELTWPGLELTRVSPTHASSAHNIWVRPDGEVFVCDSMNGSLLEAHSGRTLWKSAIPNVWTRGLACAGDYIFVGMSQAADRLGRTKSDGGVWILDRNTFQEIDFIVLPKSGGVHELRVVDEPDECHHGRPLLKVPPLLDEPTETYRAEAAKPTEVKVPEPFPVVGPWTIRIGSATLVEDVLQFDGKAPLTLATHSDVQVADVSLSVDVSLKSSAHQQFVGLVARYAGLSDQNMVCALLEFISTRRGVLTKASLWNNHSGSWTSLAEAAWRNKLPRVLRFDAIGTSLAMMIDGQRVLSAECPQCVGPGRVGLRGVTGRFRNFHATEVSRVQAA